MERYLLWQRLFSKTALDTLDRSFSKCYDYFMSKLDQPGARYNLLEEIRQSNPEPERFSVDMSIDDDGAADILDGETSLWYTIFRTQDISDGRKGKWSLLADGVDTEDAWHFRSGEELLRECWELIKDDAENIWD